MVRPLLHSLLQPVRPHSQCLYALLQLLPRQCLYAYLQLLQRLLQSGLWPGSRLFQPTML